MPLIKFLEKYPICTIISLVFIMMLPWLDSAIVTIMEARNFITAREMLNQGNWILTTLNEVPRYEKPPLPTWITAISGWIFGIKNVWALRLPAVGMISLVGIYTYYFSLRYFEKRFCLINALVAITSFYVLAIIIEAPWDIYTHAFMLIAIVHLLRSYTSNKSKDYIIAVIAIACSVLSKGPISLYALFLPFIIAYPIVYGFKNQFLLKTVIPLLIGIALGASWFIYVRISDPETFLRIAATETSNWSSYQTKPIYYYWSFFIQSGLWTIPAFISLLYPYLIKRVSNRDAYRFSFFWTLFSFILLSVIPEKKTRYLMPVLIPLAINTGFYIQYLVKEFASLKKKVERLPVYINFGLLGALGVLFPVIGIFILGKEINTVLTNYFIGSLFLIIIGAILLLNLYRKKMLTVFYSTVFLFATILCFVVPILTTKQNQNEVFLPITGLKKEAKAQNLEVYLLDQLSPEMLWDYGSSIHLVEKTGDEYQFPNEKRFGLLVNSKDNLLNSNASELFEIVEVATYNRNILKQSARRHRQRNINYYYILTAKTKE